MNPEEIWQVDVSGKIYEAGLDELKQWVIEGAVLPSDKIRRGNLRWLEAGRVPLLNGVFNQRPAENPPQVQTNTTQFTPTGSPQINSFANTAPPQNIVNEPLPKQAEVSPENPPTPPPTEIKQNIQTKTYQSKIPQTNVNHNVCSNHPADEAKFICLTCQQLFCRSCPKNYGDVRICPACGEMCKSLVEVQQKQSRHSQHQNAVSEGFGFGDFINALVFPFKHPVSLLIGGVMFSVFSVGQSALNLGALYVAVGGLFGMMLANMLSFACLSNTIDEFSNGNLTANFMPQFDDFNLWDDVIHPFFLNIGVYIVTYGFLAVVIIGGIYFAAGAMKTQLNTLDSLPSADSQNASNAKPAMRSFEELMRKDAEQKSKLAELKGLPVNAAVQPPPNDIADLQKTKEIERQAISNLEKTIGDLQKNEVSSIVGANPEAERFEQEMFFSTLMSYGIPFLGLLFLSVLWAVFYYPAACLVAGYTRNFAAVINPLVGLDTIKRLGFSYVKILVMTLLLGICVGFIIGIVELVLSPFDLPRLGNIPATVISSFIYFYFYIVFAAILGYAVYKCKNLLNNN
jgi:hypothetical protein